MRALVAALVVIAAAGAFVAASVTAGPAKVDVRGVVLTGERLAAFVTALLGVTAAVLVAAWGTWRRRSWARVVLVGAWPAAATVCLALDRSVPGIGRSLWYYLGWWGLVPAALMWVVCYHAAPLRGHFAPPRR